ncbi:tagaturonate reductase [Pustulibacterium marinum]|uniref:Tagaturonate reductase n=1 Tax=Pustulibacterium marinum TaxID=1224947 RepID=A0A1I7EUF1_9FLAO|nr:tagaturonate reductase [Pustulibacterium marinum]SFU27551.1 tagaturonate reductase [Pustulibacterium marinum]
MTDTKNILNRTNAGLEEKLPVKIVQFGEGNFLRAFVDYAIQKLNTEAGTNFGVSIVQPIAQGMVNMINDQEGLYTLFMQGIKKGKEIREHELISSIVDTINPYEEFKKYLALAKEDSLEFIISNTTEAGIAYSESDRPNMQPPKTFPGKITVLLYKRFQHFNGASDKGLTIIPCELINYNADTLKEIIFKYCDDWNLGSEFKDWITHSCSFHNTLVDRIVPGYPRDTIEDYNAQLTYKDNLIVTAEVFFLWVIEGDEALKKKLPFDKTDLDVKVVENMQPYRTRKVRILNGAHTTMVPFGLLYGKETVKDAVDGNFTGEFIQKAVFEEIIPTLEMDKEELETFAEEVFDRFRNPFIKHNLSSIALNSISKFKVRVLPSLLGYIDTYKKIPCNLTFAFACLIRFYKGTWNGKELPVNDDEAIVSLIKEIWSTNDFGTISEKVLSNVSFWDQDLTQIKGLNGAITLALNEIEKNGIETGYNNFKLLY